MSSGADGIVFVLTENNLREGGRSRDPLEAYLNVDSEKALYLGDDELLCETDDGQVFVARATGDHFKNFRSHHAVDLGGWIKVRCRALPGDEIHAQWANGDERVLRLAYVRKYAVPEKDGESVKARRMERETEDGIVAELTAAGAPVRRQVRTASGVIDLLTPDAIYEVKTFLTRDSIFQGLGQLTVYASDGGAGARLRRVLVGRETHETAALLPALERLEVEVWLWTG
jgi:hypothetical protein